ncbi:MAG: hypothetical protein L6R48_13925, partial [Planctomycetes bacterium]|nr:hypothetical protein [Planctomycetota bacterium]
MSMTGFGEGRARGPAGEAVVRIGGVNHKGAQAQVAVRGDLHDPALEDELRTRVRDALERGAVTVQVALAPARALAVDPARLVAAWRELAAAAEVNLGTFVYHFGNRDAFIDELVELWYAALFDELKAVGTVEWRYADG